MTIDFDPLSTICLIIQVKDNHIYSITDIIKVDAYLNIYFVNQPY